MHRTDTDPLPAAPFARLVAAASRSSFTLPAAAWRAVEAAAVASSSRPFAFADLPAGPEEAAVLSVWLSAILDGDAGTEGDRRRCWRRTRRSSRDRRRAGWWRSCGTAGGSASRTMPTGRGAPEPSVN